MAVNEAANGRVLVVVGVRGSGRVLLVEHRAGRQQLKVGNGGDPSDVDGRVIVWYSTTPADEAALWKLLTSVMGESARDGVGASA
jgi:hypothetical protein